jgi:hypothetical protein
MEVNYKQKYLKYKNKYLELKNQQNGGFDPFLLANHFIKPVVALAEQTSRVAYRKITCPLYISTETKKLEQTKIKIIFANLINQGLKPILFKNLLKNGSKSDGFKLSLSYADQLKNNISLAIQVIKNKIEAYTIKRGQMTGLSKQDGTRYVAKDYTSYADYDEIVKYKKQITVTDKAGEEMLNKLYELRGLIDCYCKSIVNYTNSTQINELSKCTPFEPSEFIE